MASSGFLPSYVEPCISQRHNSIDSNWLNASDFGECYSPPSDSLHYPRLIPVYNGKVLDIESELVHASLSGISIKHYYGKCIKPEEGDILYGDDTELYDYELVDGKPESLEPPPRKEPSTTLTESGSFSYRISWHNEGEPLCALPKINNTMPHKDILRQTMSAAFGYRSERFVTVQAPFSRILQTFFFAYRFQCRNSFWNIHRPELCKLTWGQKYLGASTIIEHLHEHLINHGRLCNGFHNEEDRSIMVNKELNEYVRLKVLLCPKEIPPDEPLYNFKDSLRIMNSALQTNCKTRTLPHITEVINENERFITLSDDEETTGKRIHRSEEEFCVTIGKHVRKLTILQPFAALEESRIKPRFSYNEAPEEDRENFYYDWYLYSGEEYLEHYSDKTETSEGTTITESDFPTKLENKLDEFCRGVGKVDYSDIQCKPDF